MTKKIYLRLVNLFVGLAIVMFATPAAADFNVNGGNAQLVDGSLGITAGFNLDLGDEVEEALNKGIPLIIAIEVKLLRQRDYLWDNKLAQWRINRELTFHALSNRYILRNLTQTEYDTFSSLSDALVATGNMATSWDVKALGIKSNQRYRVAIRARLDIEAFPAPLRLAAYLSPSWHLTSKWERWPLQM